MDSDFNLKIADFGFSTLLQQDERHKLHTLLGTQGYMAPEILMRKPYSGEAADLFACAVILFLMVSENLPFTEAHPQADPLYKLICMNKSDEFWEVHEKHLQKTGKNCYSEEFKDFISTMFSADPSWRLTISEIKAHPWYNGPILSKQELQNEFLKRRKEIDHQRKKEKRAKEQLRVIARQKPKNPSIDPSIARRPFRSAFEEIESVNV